MRAQSSAAAMLHSAIIVISQMRSCDMARHGKLAAGWLLHLRKNPPAVSVSYPSGFGQLVLPQAVVLAAPVVEVV